jgi:hypothetical protein
MHPTAPERRRAERVAVETPSWLSLPTSWSVQLIDVGMGGVSFSSPHPIEEGRTVYMTATLDGAAFSSPIRICWCKLRNGTSARRRRYETGGTFLQLEEESRKTLWRFLRMSASE